MSNSKWVGNLTRSTTPLPAEDGTFMNGRIDTGADLIISTDNVGITMRLPQRLTQAQYDRMESCFEMGKDMLKERIVSEPDAAYALAAEQPILDE